MFSDAVERRDAHITAAEIRSAARRAMQRVASNSFQHFWEDGIFERAELVEEVSMNRRKVLLAWAQAKRDTGIARREQIIAQAREFDVAEQEVDRQLRDFERRRILTSSGNAFECVVPFFGAWLCTTGTSEIITTFTDPDAVLIRKREEEQAYITPEEIVRLTAAWGPYAGRSITEDQIRAWLAQFGENRHRRLMFQLLQRLRFYRGDLIRAKMSEAHGIVARTLVTRLSERKGQRKRGDIMVSYLDGPGKSGSHYARLYADENDIYYESVVELGKLGPALPSSDEVQGIVFIDDFIGTGGSATEYLRRLARECPSLAKQDRVQLFFLAVSGFLDGQARVQRAADDLGLALRVHVCDPLDESFRCFSDNSAIFPDTVSREKAREIALKHGSKLVKKNPLGYGDCEAAVVFESSCPNNSLPILWSETKEWRPLFPRL